MRRNSRGRRGGYSGGPAPQRWQQNAPVFPVPPPAGPLMTDHRDLQNINKELELIQRKREIIKQQQEMISNDFRRNDYQEPYNESLGFNNYAVPYKNARDYNPPSHNLPSHNLPSHNLLIQYPINRKRPSTVWADDVPNKRFNAQNRPKTRPYQPAAPHTPRYGSYRGGHQGAFSHQPMSQPSEPFNPKKSKKNTIPNARAPAPNNPVNSKNTEDDQISDPVSVNPNNRLTRGREPTKQMTGRIELALGSIFKEIKSNLDSNALKSVPVMRDVKLAVRDRIRECMIGKIVGTPKTIKARYRETYTMQSDLEVVANALEAHTGEFTLFNIDDPEKYFKVNMNRIMQWKLKKLLDQLMVVARTDANVAADATADDFADPEKIPFDAKIIDTETYKTLERWMTVKMSSVIKKSLPFITKLMNVDGKFSKLKHMVTSETVKMLQNENPSHADKLPTIDFSADVTTTSGPEPVVHHMQVDRTLFRPPLYAKLIGEPSLPNRSLMEVFFEPFKPMSIKKHRSMQNQLFVGFTEKKDFDAFLAADGTEIDNKVLNIKKRIAAEEPKNTDVNTSTDDKIIGAELDEQITDLLTSIRNAEENDKADEQDTDAAGTTANADNTTQKTKTVEETKEINKHITVQNSIPKESKQDTTEKNDDMTDGQNGKQDTPIITEDKVISESADKVQELAAKP